MANQNFLATAAGRKVYTNGSYAPTRGQVDPRGYIKREESNRRAGLAKAALAKKGGRLGGGISQPRQGAASLGPSRPGTIPRQNANNLNGGPKTIPRQDVGNLPGGKNRKRTATLSNGSNKKDKWHTAPAKPTAPVTPTPAVPKPDPYITINANGQLDLPYSKDLSWNVLNQTESMNQQLRDLAAQQQQQSLEYGQVTRDLGTQFGEVQRQTLNQNAGRGMAFSSQYGNAVANNATQYNNQVTDVNARNTQFQQGTEIERMGIQNAFNDMLRKAGLLAADEQAPNAGELGYGKGKPKPSKNPKIPKKDRLKGGNGGGRGKKKPDPKKVRKAAKGRIDSVRRLGKGKSQPRRTSKLG